MLCNTSANQRERWLDNKDENHDGAHLNITLLWEKVNKTAEMPAEGLSVHYPQCDETADGRLSGHVHKMPNQRRFCFQSDIYRCCHGDEAADKQRAQNTDDVRPTVTYQMKTSVSCTHTKIFTLVENIFKSPFVAKD